MSARLIYDPGALHDFRDDLESSIYVLMWTTLLYSEVSERDQVMPFLTSVLDPRSYNNTGGTAKEDFLKAQSFLQHVTFPNRPALHQLIINLANLFQHRYLPKPSDAEREVSRQLLMTYEHTQNAYVKAAYEQQYPTKYDQSTRDLDNHAVTIELFETALRNHSEWPDSDPSVKQVFEPQRPPVLVVKTDWRGTTHYEGDHME
jgi:hypothetical protein